MVAALDGACSASVSPYQEVASGFDNEKFNGDYGVGIPQLQTRQPLVTLAKGVDNIIVGPALPQFLTYTIPFTTCERTVTLTSCSCGMSTNAAPSTMSTV